MYRKAKPVDPWRLCFINILFALLIGHRRVLQISRHKNSPHGHYNDRGGLSMLIWLALARWSYCSLTGAGAATIWSSLLTPHSSLLTNNQPSFLSRSSATLPEPVDCMQMTMTTRKNRSLNPTPNWLKVGQVVGRERSTIRLSVMSCLMNIN